MNFFFQLKWTLLVLLQYEIIVTSPSITGVTYMDNFDFEERYRNVNECNPFYWHPLHLPDYCASIFEKLIRSRIASKTPVRIVREREKDTIYSLEPARTRYGYPQDNYDFPFPIYQITSSEYDDEIYSQPYGQPLPLTPYEKILELLKEDIKKGPSSPTVTVMPNIGPVALYNQGISKKSVNYIRKLAEAYVEATKKTYDDYYAAYGNYPTDPQLYVYDSAKNNTKSEKKKKNKKNKDKNKVYRMKTKHGGVVTIVETKNLHLLKDEGLQLPPEWGNIQMPMPEKQ